MRMEKMNGFGIYTKICLEIEPRGHNVLRG